MSRHGGFRPAHAGTPQPGNPGFQQSIGVRYEGKHKAGCLAVTLPALTAGLLGLGAVLLIVYRFTLG